MKHLKSFVNVPLVKDDIMDILTDVIDEGLFVYVYCTDTIVMISIKPNYPRLGLLQYSNEEKPKPFPTSVVKSDIERVINYLGDEVSSVGYTYTEKKWKATTPCESIPDKDIYELNVEIRLNKLKEIDKLFSDKTRTNESENISKSRKYIEGKCLEEIRDIIIDVSDECVTDVSVYSRNSIGGKTLYNINVNYNVDDRSKGVKHSINTSIDLYNKSHNISKYLFDALKRLEAIGYDIAYRKIESWSINDGSGLDAKIQMWK